VGLSRVTWLVLGTAMALVSAVILVATFFVDIGQEDLPSGGGTNGQGGVVQVGAGGGQGAGIGEGNEASLVRAAGSVGRGAGAARAAGRSVPVSTRSSPQGPSVPGLGSPTKQQYSSTVQQLNAALRSR
jgi:hypothetical protein